MQQFCSSWSLIFESLHIPLTNWCCSKYFINFSLNLRGYHFIYFYSFQCLFKLFWVWCTCYSCCDVRIFYHPCYSKLGLWYFHLIRQLLKFSKRFKSLLFLISSKIFIIKMFHIRMVIKPTSLWNTIVILSCQHSTC